jgi:hypothetical protein
MSLKVPEAVVPPKRESGGSSAIVRLVSDFELPEVILYVAMKVACSPDLNFESRLDPDSPVEGVVVVELGATVVTVVEVFGAAVVTVVLVVAVVVVVLVLVLEHPAATIATTAASARPTTTRRGSKFLASLLIWVLPPSGHPFAGGSMPQERPPGDRIEMSREVSSRATLRCAFVPGGRGGLRRRSTWPSGDGR